MGNIRFRSLQLQQAAPPLEAHSPTYENSYTLQPLTELHSSHTVLHVGGMIKGKGMKRPGTFLNIKSQT